MWDCFLAVLMLALLVFTVPCFGHGIGDFDSLDESATCDATACCLTHTTGISMIVNFAIAPPVRAVPFQADAHHDTGTSISSFPFQPPRS